MVFKPSSAAVTEAIASPVLVAGAVVFFGFATEVWIAAICALLLLPISIHYSITVGRTIIMDQGGCTVRFLGIKKFYPWHTMKTIRCEECSLLAAAFENRFAIGPEKRWIIFSPYKVRRSVMAAVTRGTFSIFPFSYIFVFLHSEDDCHWARIQKSVRYYTAEEAELRNKLSQWGITVQETKHTNSSKGKRI